MDYLDFDAEHFLLDESFQQYCLGTNDEAVAFWTNWRSAHPEKNEQVKEAQALYLQLNGNITQKDFAKDYSDFQTAFNRYKSENTITPPVKKPTQIYRLLAAVGAVAAAVLVFVVIWLPRMSGSKIDGLLTYEAQPGKRLQVKLADGTTVRLNGGSRLTVSADYNKKDRTVSLDGEGYFTVTHNQQKPFQVQTIFALVKDKGTVFNLKAYRGDDAIEASLIEGAIEVITKQPKGTTVKPYTLQPGTKLVIPKINADAIKTISENASVKPLTIDINSKQAIETNWTRGQLSFNEESLDEIAVKLHRWYNVSVKVMPQADRTNHFNGTFENNTIEDVLEALKTSGNFNYRKEGDVISIY